MSVRIGLVRGPSIRDEMARTYMLSRAIPKVEIEVPVNWCPDDDPADEPRPMEKVWAEDSTAVVDALLSSEAIRMIRAEAWDAGASAMANEWMQQDRDPDHPITRNNPFDKH